jgi:hypothetical protein
MDYVIFALYSWKNKALSQASLKNSKATMRAWNFPDGYVVVRIFDGGYGLIIQ